MPGMAAKVVISERQQQVLQTMAFSRSCAKGLAHRAEVILLAFEGYKNEDIAKKLHCERHSVGIWRRRWQKYFRCLTVIECAEKPAALREAVEEVLSDLPRSGVSPKMAQSLARHSDINLTMSRYTHIGLHDQAAALEALPPLSPPKREERQELSKSAG